MKQYQTLQVFKGKRPAAFAEDQARASSLYGSKISAKKDMEKMKVKAAGINRDTLMTTKKLKEDLLETSFKISFQKELEGYKSNNTH